MMQVAIGKDITLDVDVDKLPANVMAHVVYMGLRNVLMDSHAAHTKEADGENYQANSRATAERKLAAMYNGEVRSIGTREGDPVKAEAIRLATAQVRKHLKQVGRKDILDDGKAVRELALKLIGKNPSIMTLAKKRVDEAKATELDVSGII